MLQLNVLRQRRVCVKGSRAALPSTVQLVGIAARRSAVAAVAADTAAVLAAFALFTGPRRHHTILVAGQRSIAKFVRRRRSRWGEMCMMSLQ